MAWYNFWRKLPEPEVIDKPFITPSIEKVEFNIARYRRAIEQNTKGDQRLAQLTSNLAYWEKVKELIFTKPE